MIVKRAVALAAALAALMAAMGCAVVALCFAIYALLRDVITPAGASATIVLLCAVIAGIAAWVMFSRFKPHHGARPVAPPPTIGDRVLDVVRDRPIVTAGLALVAGVAAFANPALVTAALRAFTDRPRNRP